MILNYKYVSNFTSFDNYPDSIVTLNGRKIKNTREFSYLGDTLNYNQAFTGDSEVNYRISLAEKKFNELKSKLFNFKIPRAIRLKFLNAFVRSRLTYSCQTWSLTVRQINKINSFYIRCLRFMVRNDFIRTNGKYLKQKVDQQDDDDDIVYSFRYTNEDIWKITKCEKLDTFIMRLKTRYLAHLPRQANTTISKQLIFAIKDNNVKSGNSILTLEESVVKNVTKKRTKALNGDFNQFYRQALKRIY